MHDSSVENAHDSKLVIGERLFARRDDDATNNARQKFFQEERLVLCYKNNFVELYRQF